MTDHSADVHAAITLTTVTQSVTTAISNPNAPRRLSVTGAMAGTSLSGNVTITGTDETGAAASETFALANNATLFGRQLFATVTAISLPVRVTASDAVKVGVADRLFDLPTARAFDKEQLADSGLYTDAEVLAKEEELREFFEVICGVNMLPTVHSDEYHSGDGSSTLMLDWPRPLAVTAAATRSDSSWTAFSAGEIADIQVESSAAGILYREGGHWPSGVRNLRLTYVAGYHAVPELIARAALMVMVTEMPRTNIAFAAESYDAGGMAVSFAQGDGYNDAWHRIPEVRRAIRLYRHRTHGIW